MIDIEELREEFQNWRYTVPYPMSEIDAANMFVDEMNLPIQPSELLENNV